MAADTLITTATATSARDPVRLTRYSHGAGCGCKLSPQVLEVILAGSSGAHGLFPGLWVGNASRDDAAVHALDDERAVVSTTHFFIPILGCPGNGLPAEVARTVVDGGRAACAAAGIALAGGHSIDAPEPFFGLAVTGVVEKRPLKRNDTATAGCRLYLTKPLGIGILTTAE